MEAESRIWYHAWDRSGTVRLTPISRRHRRAISVLSKKGEIKTAQSVSAWMRWRLLSSMALWSISIRGVTQNAMQRKEEGRRTRKTKCRQGGWTEYIWLKKGNQYLRPQSWGPLGFPFFLFLRRVFVISVSICCSLFVCSLRHRIFKPHSPEVRRYQPSSWLNKDPSVPPLCHATQATLSADIHDQWLLWLRWTIAEGKTRNWTGFVFLLI